MPTGHSSYFNLYSRLLESIRPFEITVNSDGTGSIEYECIEVTNHRKDPIKKVIFNDPATIVFWIDGTKTIVKVQNNEHYDKLTGLAMCIAKKALGNKGNYYEIFKKWIGE